MMLPTSVLSVLMNVQQVLALYAQCATWAGAVNSSQLQQCWCAATQQAAIGIR
jgi:hypothetical protein